GAGSRDGAGTYPFSIDAAGAIVGYWVDRDANGHGFVRDAAGVVTTFDPDGAATTFARSVSPGGALAGWFYPTGSNSVAHAYVRAPGGAIEPFDVPGFAIAETAGINDGGTVVGNAYQTGVGWRAYRRGPNGRVSLLELPPSSIESGASAINAHGSIT